MKPFLISIFCYFFLIGNLFSQAEPIAHLTVDQLSILENGGITKVTVSLKDISENLKDAAVDIDVELSMSGTASIGTDYNITNSTNSNQLILTIPAGSSSGFLTINSLDDNQIEPEENIIIQIENISTGSIHSINNDRTVNILDDDLEITLSVEAGDTFLLEEGTPKTLLRIEMNQAVSEDVEVQVGMTGGDASAFDVNYTGVVKIDDGSTSANFEIYAVDDNAYENTEIFYLKLTNVKSGPGRIVNDSLAFTIVDNDPPKASLSIDKDSIDENGGVAKLTITLSRIYNKDSKVALNYEGLIPSINPSLIATKDSDFSSDKTDIITIPAGSLTAEVLLTAIDDNIQDPNEKIVITLNNTTNDSPKSENISYEPDNVVVKIVDDENPPIAGDDVYDNAFCVDEGKELIINNPAEGLLVNDSDSEGPIVSIATTNFPLAGFVSCPSTGLPGICADGTFSYQHNGDETPSGSDSFSYTIEDEDGFTATGSVTICVNPVNDCPVVDGEALKVNEGEVATRDLTQGVLDPEFTLGIDPVLTFKLITPPPVGTVTVSDAGIAVYTAPSFVTGSDPLNTSFEYQVTDGGGCIRTDVIMIQINNSVPQAVADTFVVGVGGTINIPAPGVLANDPIPSSATAQSGVVTSPTIAITSGPDAFKLNSDGSFTYTHNGSTSPKFDEFTYRLTIIYSAGVFDVTDGKVVIKVNDCPTTVPDTYIVDEGGTLIIDSIGGLLSNDSDINGDEIQAFKDSEPSSKGSLVTVNQDGSFTYTHGGAEDPLDYFLYYANDGLCNSDPDTVKIIVQPVNDCPVTRVNGYNSLSLLGGAPIKDYIESLNDINGDPVSIDSVSKGANGDTLLVYASDGFIWILEMDEGGTLTKDSLNGALKLDTDPEGDDIFMRELLPGADNWLLDANGDPVYPFPAHAKSYTVNADGSFTYEHDGTGNVRDRIYVEVCDIPKAGKSCCSVDSIMLFFGPDNACAKGLTDYFTVNEGGSLIANQTNLGYNIFMDSITGGRAKYTGVLLNDVDEEGDTLNVKLGTLPLFGVIVDNKINPDGSFTYVHDGGEQTADFFTYTMGDMQRECAEVTVFINVLSVNECPTANDTVYTVAEGGTLTISGLPGGSEGNFNNFPAIMNNDFDKDIGSRPQIINDLIAFYSMSEYYDSIPGPGEDVDGKIIPTIIVNKMADDQSRNNFNGFMKGGIADTLSLPNPPGCEAATDGKCQSPVYMISYPNAPTIVPDRFQPPKDRNAFGFDGVDSYVEVEDQILNLKRSRYTISGWFRSFNTASDIATLLNFTVDDKEKGLTIGIQDNKLSLGIGNGSGYSVKNLGEISNTLNNQWNHFVLIKNENNYKVYLNKKEIYSEDLNNVSLSSIPAKLIMGKTISGNYFKGRMDELYIIGDTISSDQILSLYYGVSTSLTNAPDDGDLTYFGTDGSFTYVHNGKDGDYEDNFIYELSDGECSELGKVKIIITPVNDCPVGVNDTIRVDEGGTVTLDAPGILLNDTDEENDTLTAEKLIDPLHGIAQIDSDGKIIYIHDDSETLLDSLKYVVKDGSTCADTATVYIFINPVPDCPIPNTDIYNVLEGGILVIDTCETKVLNPGSNNENWTKNEPNDAGGTENIGELLSDGTWNDGNEFTFNMKYLMEVNSLIKSKSGYTYIGQYDGHSYFASNLSYLWNDAKVDAENNGGYLAMLKTKAENDTIAKMISENYLFGLYQDKTDINYVEEKGGWKWIDGTYLYDTGDSRTLCGVLLNDDDGGGDTLFVNDYNLSSLDNGILLNNEIKFDGNFTYIHDGSQLGDTIKYQIESELCKSDEFGLIIINPINVNDCPVAVRDTFYVDEGGTLDTLGILLNDIDEDGDALRAEKDSTSNTNHSDTLKILPNGRLYYVHDGSESTIDSVKYKATDPTGCESIATIIIIINRVNDLPVGVNDKYFVNEGDTLVVPFVNGLLSNDFDPDNPNSQLTVLALSGLSGLTLNSDGSFTYIHDGSDKPNEVCFKYKVYDGVNGPPPGVSDETEVCITILNRLPICDGETFTILEGEVLTTDLTNGVLSNCFDPDPQDILTSILVSNPDNGAFVFNDDGTFSYDHDCSDDPNNTFFTYLVTDGEDTTLIPDTTYIEIINECPIGNDDLYSGVSEGDILTIDASNGVMSNDKDQNPCDILEIKLLDPPLFGGLILNSDGSFDYTHDDSENFIDEYTYLLNDGECNIWDTVTVTIRIDPVPDTPPVAVPDTFNCIDEGSFLQTLLPDQGVLYNDYDLDTGQNINAVLVVYPLHGTLILNPNGTFMYTHDGGESTSDSFTYYVIDDTGLTSDTVSAYLCINPINDCPIPFDDIFTINEGEIIDSSLVFNDFDVENNSLLISVVSPPTLGGFSWNQDGTFKYTAPDDIPAPGPEILTFDYILSDVDDVFATCDSTATVTIIINYVNDCPIVGNDSILVDGSTPSSRVIDVLNNDSDPDSQIDTTSVKIIGGPLFGDAISNIDGTITYNFEESPIPFDTITYSVSDYEGCEVLGKVFIYIENLNMPKYQLPNYFTPNGDDFNDYFVIKYQNINEIDMSFEVKIYDRYQRIIYNDVVESTDKIWSGIDSNTSQIVKTDFYYYEVTPVEYFNTMYVRRRDTMVGTIYLEKER